MNSDKWNKAGVEAGDFNAFRQVVAALRAPDGCPWDKEQTFESLKPCMINEMTEALAAIDIYKETGSVDNLCEELGDVLLQVVLLVQIAKEEGLFSMEDVVRGISRKMIRRHPHVFGEHVLESEGNNTAAKKPDTVATSENDLADGKNTAAKNQDHMAECENDLPEHKNDFPEKTASDQILTKEIPGRWEAIKRAEKKNRTPEMEQREKAAFKEAARDVICHLETKL